MTDDPETAAKPAESPEKPNGVPFKKGYDKRRWMGGRGKKSPEQREGEEILRAVIWEELSREFDVATMKPLEQSETIDAMRLMVRTWIKKKPETIAERIAGKVTDRVDVTSGGEKIEPKVDNERFDRAISTLANAIRDSISGTGTKQNGEVDTAK